MDYLLRGTIYLLNFLKIQKEGFIKVRSPFYHFVNFQLEKILQGRQIHLLNANGFRISLKWHKIHKKQKNMPLKFIIDHFKSF